MSDDEDDFLTEEEIEEMRESMRIMDECDHEWGPLPEEDRGIFGDNATRCPKCGGTQMSVSDRDWQALMERLGDEE